MIITRDRTKNYHERLGDSNYCDSVVHGDSTTLTITAIEMATVSINRINFYAVEIIIFIL